MNLLNKLCRVYGMHFKYIQKYSKNRVWIESGKSLKIFFSQTKPKNSCKYVLCIGIMDPYSWIKPYVRTPLSVSLIYTKDKLTYSTKCSLQLVAVNELIWSWVAFESGSSEWELHMYVCIYISACSIVSACACVLWSREFIVPHCWLCPVGWATSSGQTCSACKHWCWNIELGLSTNSARYHPACTHSTWWLCSRSPRQRSSVCWVPWYWPRSLSNVAASANMVESIL